MKRVLAGGPSDKPSISRAYRLYAVHNAAACERHAGNMVPLLRKVAADDARATRSPLLELMPGLGKLAPPATVIDKTRYSAFFEPFLLHHLRAGRQTASSLRVPRPMSS
jgi:hypothetical protein